MFQKADGKNNREYDRVRISLLKYVSLHALNIYLTEFIAQLAINYYARNTLQCICSLYTLYKIWHFPAFLYMFRNMDPVYICIHIGLYNIILKIVGIITKYVNFCTVWEIGYSNQALLNAFSAHSYSNKKLANSQNFWHYDSFQNSYFYYNQIDEL